MSQADKCPECGAELPASAPRGLCPACLLKRGLETNTIGYSEEAASARWTPPSVEELSARFPELEITRLIGRGGMGAVYQARQKNLDRVVALKILPPEMGNDPAFAERFAREARAMARLNHPHIVTIHDFGHLGARSSSAASSPSAASATSALYYFLMEYVDGVNLRGLLDSGHVSPKEALAIVPQICEALQYAHEQGIVHRDIKPENILLSKQGQVKIADFGLAKLMGRATPVAEKIMGTPQYMAPEQLDRPAEVDHRADIYSLGVVFYQMLTGELPKGNFVPPSRKVQIDVRLDEIVLRALEREPEKRYQQASEVKTQVETIAYDRHEPQARPAWHRLVAAVGTRGGKPVVNWRGVVFDLLAGATLATAGIVVARMVSGDWPIDFWLLRAVLAFAPVPLAIVLAIAYGLTRMPPERLVPLDEPTNRSKPGKTVGSRVGVLASIVWPAVRVFLVIVVLSILVGGSVTLTDLAPLGINGFEVILVGLILAVLIGALVGLIQSSRVLADKPARRCRDAGSAREVRSEDDWLIAVEAWNSIRRPLGCLVAVMMAEICVGVFLVAASLFGGTADASAYLIGLGWIVAGALSILAMVHLSEMRSYWFGVLACFPAMLLFPLNIFAIPAGMWMLFALSKREVRDAFARAAPPAGITGQPSHPAANVSAATSARAPKHSELRQLLCVVGIRNGKKVVNWHAVGLNAVALALVGGMMVTFLWEPPSSRLRWPLIVFNLLLPVWVNAVGILLGMKRTPLDQLPSLDRPPRHLMLAWAVMLGLVFMGVCGISIFASMQRRINMAESVTRLLEGQVMRKDMSIEQRLRASGLGWDNYSRELQTNASRSIWHFIGLREWNRVDGRDVWTPIDGSLTVQVLPSGDWQVYGDGQLSHIRFVVPVSDAGAQLLPGTQSATTTPTNATFGPVIQRRLTSNDALESAFPTLIPVRCSARRKTWCFPCAVRANSRALPK